MTLNATVWGLFAWGLHFFFEFISISNNSLPLYFIIFHYIGVFIGGLFGLIWLSNINPKISYFFFSVMFMISVIILILSNFPWTIPLLLFIAGFSLACSYGYFYQNIDFLFAVPKDSGKLFSLGTINYGVLIVISSLIYSIFDRNILALYISVFLLIFIKISIFIFRNYDYPVQQKISIKSFIKDPDNSIIILFSFFFGFFFTTAYYSAFVFYDNTDIEKILAKFVASLFLVQIICALFVGIIIDKIGRRLTLLIGLYIQSLLFLIISLQAQIHSFQLDENQFIMIFALIIGVGFTTMVNSGMVFLPEILTRKYYRDGSFLIMSAIGLGMSFALLLSEIFSEVIESLSIIIVFILFTSTMITFQLEETLPDKKELEWKNSIQYLLVLTDDGIVLYSQEMYKDSPRKEGPDEVLIGGAMIAISSITKEIVNRESALKVIRQEDYCILLEEVENITVVVISLNELQTIRTKMKEFLSEFMEFFSETLETWKGDVNMFLPTKKLVERSFI
ncbi:MAG: MFS transporter [Candidatus Kariarchaeaceae archaeon]